MSQHSENTTAPAHIAIVMDGNGRWAKSRGLPRMMGHKAGVSALKRTVTYCSQKNIKVLTVFGFSSENWQRPQEEVSNLMKLFLRVLKKEIHELHQNKICVRFIGDLSRFNVVLQQEAQAAMTLTQHNSALTLVIALNYGGRWDIFQAAQQMTKAVLEKQLDIHALEETHFAQYLSMSDLPAPDLFIRTSGECRISNFLLWQIAYTELYFCNVLWPDFSEKDLDEAINAFAARNRRYGKV